MALKSCFFSEHDCSRMKFSLIIGIFLLSHCQADFFANQPWFRGILAAFKIPSHDAEFLPSVKDSADLTSRPIVKISDGYLRGFTLRTVSDRKMYAFQSVPYAQPPVGSFRFRDPPKNLPWNVTRDALPQSPQCIQLDFTRTLQMVHGQEDCLYLNLYVPQKYFAGNASLPVMVWIHGGLYILGAGTAYGPRYLLDRDIILVTINYRLGPFGFFSTGDDASPGNQGLKDQVLALKWIQANVAAFGGNPDSVTLFGQSCGAAGAGLHMLSPDSRGLFHRVIWHSGSPFCFWDKLRDAGVTAKRVGELYQCPTDSTHEMIECLRKIPEKALAPVQLAFAEWLVFPILWFGPVVEHDHPSAFLRKHPRKYYEDGEAANVTLIAGMTDGELGLASNAVMKVLFPLNGVNTDWDRVGPALFFNSTSKENVAKSRKIWNFYMGSRYRQLNWDTRLNFTQSISDSYVNECTLEAMRYHSIYTKQPVYAYYFNYQGRYSNVQNAGSKPKDWGVVHSDDLIYLLNNPDYYPSLNLDDPEMTMSRLMTGFWTNFAKHGKPYMFSGNAKSYGDVWQPIEPAVHRFSPLRFLNLTLNPRMMDDPHVERYNFWKNEINIRS